MSGPEFEIHLPEFVGAGKGFAGSPEDEGLFEGSAMLSLEIGIFDPLLDAAGIANEVLLVDDVALRDEMEVWPARRGHLSLRRRLDEVPWSREGGYYRSGKEEFTRHRGATHCEDSQIVKRNVWENTLKNESWWLRWAEEEKPLETGKY
jgi:hypothetical protein